MFDLRQLTTIQLARLYGRAYARMVSGDGYQPFGYDWPTIRLTHPGWYDVLQAVRLEGLRRLHD